jgi:DNA-binding MarR family transcriptional regulator
MPIHVQEQTAQVKSRLAAIRLAMLTLRLMENWRERIKDYDTIMIVIAIGAITAERLTRTELHELENIARAVPADLLGTCNISSIAEATGLNRETTRRKVNKLEADGLVVRSADGTINFAPGYMQDPHITRVMGTQLEALRRTTNDLVRDGIFVVAPTVHGQARAEAQPR